MTCEQRQLIALVALAISPNKPIHKVLLERTIDWHSILEEAKKQSLVGVAFLGFKRWFTSDVGNSSSITIEKPLLTSWYLLAEKIKQDNILLNKRTSQVCRRFAKDGFRVSVMKGQGNALLYGGELSLLRASGDIDVWVEGGFKKVYDYVMKIAPTNVVNEQEIDFNVFSDAVVEIHYRPFIMRHPFRMKRLESFIKSQSERCFNNHVKLQTVSKDGETEWADAIVTTVRFNLIQQLAHIHRHLFTEGVGLRQVMDYYFLLIHAEQNLNQDEKSEVIALAKAVGLERLACALMWILSAYFGLPEKCLLWEPNREDGDFLLEEIMRTGNFGKMDNRHPEGYKTGGILSFLYTQKRNIAMSRFDRTDWFWGSLWRIYHFAWRRVHGFTH